MGKEQVMLQEALCPPEQLTELRHRLQTIGKWYLSGFTSEELRREANINQKWKLLWKDVEVLIKGCGLNQQKHSSLCSSDRSKSSELESKITACIRT